MIERALEVRHRDALVDDEALGLREDGQVRRVELIGARDLAGREDVDRHVAFEHRAHLHGARLGAHHEVTFGRIHKERVLLLARGVILIQVQGIEVEPLVLEFRSVGDLPPHPDEEIPDRLLHERDGVAGAGTSAARNRRDVEALGLETRRVLRCLEVLLARLERLGDTATRLPHELADFRLAVLRYVAHLRVQRGERAAVALVRGARLLQRDRIGGIGGRSEGVRDGGVHSLGSDLGYVRHER